MKTLAIHLVLLLFVVGCGSTSQKERDDEFVEAIKNEDFGAPAQVNYQEYLDKFEKLDAESKDVLSTESLARVDDGDLNKLEDSKDTISQIISQCYQKEFEEAFKLIDQHYTKYKKNSSYWNQVGTCYYLQGDRRKALLFYNKAIELNKKYAPAFNNLGVLFLKERKDQKAVIAFKRALKLNNFSLTPMFNLAMLYLEYGLVDKASKILGSLYKFNGNDPDIILGMATVALFQGNVSKSLQWFKQIPKDNQSRPDVSLNYAVALHTDGKTSEAREVFGNIDRKKYPMGSRYYNRVKKFIGL